MASDNIPVARWHEVVQQAQPSSHPYTLLICLLGPFRVLRASDAGILEVSGKAAELLGHLALQQEELVPREQLLEALWPATDPLLAGQSLNHLVSTLSKRFKALLAGAPPVLRVAQYYRLNSEAGVGVDVTLFDSLVAEGERQSRAGCPERAVALYQRAVALYRGDLCLVPDAHAIVERERLRARYLTVLVRLATHAYAAEQYAASLTYGLRLVALDPYREDAHRLIMRCYVRLGERAQALRQFRLCQQLLRDEFEAAPEAATVALFDQIRHAPQEV